MDKIPKSYFFDLSDFTINNTIIINGEKYKLQKMKMKNKNYSYNLHSTFAVTILKK